MSVSLKLRYKKNQICNYLTKKKLISVQKIFIPYAFSVKYKLFRTSQSWDGAMLLTPVRLCIPPCG